VGRVQALRMVCLARGAIQLATALMEIKTYRSGGEAEARSHCTSPTIILVRVAAAKPLTRMGQTEHRLIQLSDCCLEVTLRRTGDWRLAAICASHPAGALGEGSAELLNWTADTCIVCVNPRGIGASSPLAARQQAYSLEQMVDDLEQVRCHLDIDRWVFWGMSGGGWLGQIYARRYQRSLNGLILESVCPCFRLRLADPNCVLSPFHPSWQSKLAERGMISPDSHLEAGDASATEWVEIEGVGSVFRRRSGPALLVSPMPVSPEMRVAMPVLWRVDTHAWLGELRVPTLVIAGGADAIVPVSHARALHEAIPGSQLLFIEDGGHAPVTQRRPELASAVQRFLGLLPR